MSARPIRLILDTSAIVAFGLESIDVGEPIAEVGDGGYAFGLPVPCLVEAHRHTNEERLGLLLKNPACALLAVPASSWRQLAVMRDVLGRIDAAAALLGASDNDCDILTAEPDVYAVLGDDPPVIPI